jgi:hypothetical protein
MISILNEPLCGSLFTSFSTSSHYLISSVVYLLGKGSLCALQLSVLADEESDESDEQDLKKLHFSLVGRLLLVVSSRALRVRTLPSPRAFFLLFIS